MSGTPSPLRSGLSFGLGGLSGQSLDGSRDEAGRELRRMSHDASVAEACGFDAVWVTEHHFSDDGYLPSPWVALAAISQATSRVALGVNVAIPGLHHPIALAEQVSTLDQLCSGRLVLAFGLGYRHEEFAALGQMEHKRVALMTRAIEAIRSANAGRPIPVGEADRSTVTVMPRPAQAPVPILLGSFVEPGIERAVRIGDGYASPNIPLHSLRRRLRWITEQNPPDDFSVVVTLAGFGGDLAVAEAGVRHVDAQYASWLSESGDLSLERDDPNSPWVPPDHFVHGSADECAAKLLPYCQAMLELPGNGPRHLALRVTYPGLGASEAERSIRFFGEEVLPEVRRRLR